MKKRNVPLDFFSWHIYCTEPANLVGKGERMKALLDKHGFGDIESILNEWNYIRGWTDDFKYSILSIHGIKGAAFAMACISEAQGAPIDMLMYYDTRPSAFCGVFDYYSYDKLKGYYPLYFYGMFYDMEYEVKAQNKIDNIYSLCGVDKDGKILAVITNYSEDDSLGSKDVELYFGRSGKFEIRLVDDEHDGEIIAITAKPGITLKNHSFALVREI